MCVFQKTPFFPCGTIPFRTKAIRSKHMRRLVNVSVNCILGGRHISYRITHKFEVLFPCGKTQQVRRMRSRPQSHAFCFFLYVACYDQGRQLFFEHCH